MKKKQDLVRVAGQLDARVVDIIERVAEGETVRAICEEPGQITARTFYRIIAKHPDGRKLWDIAKDMRSHALFDRGLKAIETLETDKFDKEDGALVRAREAAAKALFYAAARLNPREYSEKQPAISAQQVIINTSLNLGQDGKPADDVNESVYHIQASVPIDATFEPSGEAKPHGGKKSRRTGPPNER